MSGSNWGAKLFFVVGMSGLLYYLAVYQHAVVLFGLTWFGLQFFILFFGATFDILAGFLQDILRSKVEDFDLFDIPAKSKPRIEREVRALCAKKHFGNAIDNYMADWVVRIHFLKRKLYAVVVMGPRGGAQHWMVYRPRLGLSIHEAAFSDPMSEPEFWKIVNKSDAILRAFTPLNERGLRPPGIEIPRRSDSYGTEGDGGGST